MVWWNFHDFVLNFYSFFPSSRWTLILAKINPQYHLIRSWVDPSRWRGRWDRFRGITRKLVRSDWTSFLVINSRTSVFMICLFECVYFIQDFCSDGLKLHYKLCYLIQMFSIYSHMFSFYSYNLTNTTNFLSGFSLEKILKSIEKFRRKKEKKYGNSQFEDPK